MRKNCVDMCARHGRGAIEICLSASLHDIEQLCAMYDIIFLQETWLAKQTLDKLTDISDNHLEALISPENGSASAIFTLR